MAPSLQSYVMKINRNDCHLVNVNTRQMNVKYAFNATGNCINKLFTNNETRKIKINEIITTTAPATK